MNTEEISRDKLHDDLCSVYSLSTCDRYAVMVYVDALIKKERQKYDECEKLLSWIIDNVPSSFWRENKYRAEVLSKIGEIVHGDKVK